MSTRGPSGKGFSDRELMVFGSSYLRGLSVSHRPLDAWDRDWLKRLADALARQAGVALPPPKDRPS